MSFAHIDDIVDIIAPSSMKCHDALEAGKAALQQWGLQARAPADIFGDDILYTNSDTNRFNFLKNALLAEDSNMIWALRGGCGATRLIPQLEKMAPLPQKTLIGFSDITALHIFFYQNWNWKTCIHGPNLRSIGLKNIDEQSINAIKNRLFGIQKTISIQAEALNKHCDVKCEGKITGGNLSLIQASIGTSWQLNTDDHIVLLEDIDEKPYRTAERLEHFRQAGLFKNIRGLIFADFNFLTPIEEKHKEIYPQVLKNFADEVGFPVLKMNGIGHMTRNLPFTLGQTVSFSQNNQQFMIHI